MRTPHAGVRVGIVFGAATVIWLLVDQFRTALFGESDYERGAHVFSAVATTLLVVPMVAMAYRYLDRLPWSGLRRGSLRTPGRLVTAGAVTYLIPAAIAVTVFVVAGWVSIEVRGSPAPVLALVVLVLFYEALPEELVFRGYVFRNLETLMPAWAVVVVQAVLFALFGVLVGAAQSVERIVLFFGFAIVQGSLRAITGTLWVPVGFHLAFQTVEQMVGPHWDLVVVDDLALLQDVVLGLIPLTLGAFVVRLLGGWARRPPI